ncbi:MAG: 16S rRNA (guanine(966)-N(2))-methyltransferase RsmD [Eubacteriales bacterium]|nr:16S rRNA (guanine(966)-N(2))-methyltransferase RsmD [Eubacteriales bacterium]MDD4324462.1 16S rRNA (guanine(966)-N(2))-methyltransferase RsmD [Eubacteriales bacterium]MDD4541601.1 16S rRNA (guanine(966)-N(2))-methyltransferase RsmD [Eubacteriales bacterium]
MPRIISGSLRGYNLQTPAGSDTRPTSDRAKEALFSIIGPDIEGARVLDLFAGSGQIALEALSRGAAHAVLCEIDREALKTLFFNIEKTRTSERIKVFTYDAKRVVKKLSKEEFKFDFIYLDPPWRELNVLFDQIKTYLPALLAPSGVLVLESERKQKIPASAGDGLSLSRSCTYGASVLSFYYHERD